jgi:hypothetical protein
MKHLFLIILVGGFVLACQKDKLAGNKNFLIGKWNWIYTQYTYGWCEYDTNYETITPLSLNKKFTVEFLKKGQIHFYENDALLEKNRIVFNYFEQGSDGAYYFYFYLDNDLEKGMAGSIHGDTLHFDYPLVEENPDCENYLNFLVRE